MVFGYQRHLKLSWILALFYSLVSYQKLPTKLSRACKTFVKLFQPIAKDFSCIIFRDLFISRNELALDKFNDSLIVYRNFKRHERSKPNCKQTRSMHKNEQLIRVEHLLWHRMRRKQFPAKQPDIFFPRATPTSFIGLTLLPHFQSTVCLMARMEWLQVPIKW